MFFIINVLRLNKMKFFWQIIAVSFFSISIIFAQNSTSKFRAFLANKDFEQAGEVAQSALNENPNDFELAISVGDVFFELEEFNKAFDAYSKAKTINNRDNRVNAKLANSLVALGKAKEAIGDLKKLLERDRRNEALLIALANAHLANGDIRDAEMQVTNARSINNKNPAVFTMLGKIYFEQKIWELARTNYEDALLLDPNNVQARQQLAEVYWQLAVSADNAGERELLNEYLNRSLEHCNILVRNDDKDANSWRLKGQIHFNANQHFEAAQSYNKFLELRPNNYRERWRLTELLVRNGVCSEAFQHLNLVINSKHSDITDSIKYQAKLLLGTCHYREKAYLEAAKALETANKQIPLEANDLRILALSYLLGGDTVNALTNFNRLFEIAPKENCEMMVRVGTAILRPMGKLEETVKILKLRNQICNDEHDAFAHYSLGTAYYDLKNVEASIEAIKRAIEINPRYFWAYIYLGDIYCAQKNIAEGEKQFAFVIENAKGDIANSRNELHAAFVKLAGLKLEAKQFRDLERIAKEWLNIMPDDNEFAHLYLAVAYQGQNDARNACRHYNEVLKINRDNRTARDNLRNLGC